MKLLNAPFLRLLISQSQVAFNNNSTKLMIIGVANMVLPLTEAMRYVSILSLLLVTPFVVLSPFSGWVIDRFAKRDVIVWSLRAQIAAMTLLLISTSFHSLPAMSACFFLMAAITAVYSPAKRAIINDTQEEENIQKAVGLLEMTGMLSILIGSLVGGLLSDILAKEFKSPWIGSIVFSSITFTLCLGSTLLFRGFPKGTANVGLPFNKCALFGHWQILQKIRNTKGIMKLALSEGIFYFVAGVLIIVAAQIARTNHPNGSGVAAATGLFMASIGVGTGIGSVLAGLTRRMVRSALIPLAAFGMAGSLFALSQTGAGWHQFLLFFLCGIFGGFYCVPVSSSIVEKTPSEIRGSIMAGTSLLTGLAGITATGFQWIIGQKFNFSANTQLEILGSIVAAGGVFAVFHTQRGILSLIAMALTRIFYKVTTINPQNVPSSGGALLVANHTSYIDTLILCIAIKRPICFLAYSGLFKTPILGTILRTFRAIPVDKNNAKQAIRDAAESIKQGNIVCIFPEGELTRTGVLMEIKSGYQLISKLAGCPIIPVFIDGLWTSIFSYERESYFFKKPNTLSLKTRVTIGEPKSEISKEELRREFSLLSAAGFDKRPELRENISRLLHRQIKRSLFKTLVVDSAMPEGSNRLRGLELLGVSLSIRKQLKKESSDHIGIILPPGLAGTLATVSVIFSGKNPHSPQPNIWRKSSSPLYRKSQHYDNPFYSTHPEEVFQISMAGEYD